MDGIGLAGWDQNRKEGMVGTAPVRKGVAGAEGSGKVW